MHCALHLCTYGAPDVKASAPIELITKLIEKKYKQNYKFMTRVKRGNVARKRHKKILTESAGFRGSSGILFRTANQSVLKARHYSFSSRHQKKRHLRTIWINRVNAISRTCGLNYSSLIHQIKKSQMIINRKILAQLAVRDLQAFYQLVEESKN